MPKLSAIKWVKRLGLGGNGARTKVGPTLPTVMFLAAAGARTGRRAKKELAPGNAFRKLEAPLDVIQPPRVKIWLDQYTVICDELFVC